ncbi:RE1 [Symbiodinium sp. CCMP2592]|nr:RE1 [Symbiodinium sp. CCMP2592]
MFEQLVGQQRMDLLEVMCEPDSLLTATFQRRTGRSDSACRCSLWCGHDLSTPGGLAVTLEQIRTLKPRHVWLSPPSGPFSPLQSINQRTPSQIQELKAKRANATRIYESTLEIAKVCMQMGIHVSVEISERSEAWRLPVLQKLRFNMGLHTCTVKGCAVGLVGQDGQLMQKGWRGDRWVVTVFVSRGFQHVGSEEVQALRSLGFPVPKIDHEAYPATQPLPPKFTTVSADIGHWVHPQTEESVYFMVIIDEGSRFRTTRILTRGPRQAPNAQHCLQYLQEGWVQYFGYPKCLRLDPAGAFRSQAVEDWCDRHSVFLDIVPGEAHWKIGACENAVHGVKEVMQKLCQYDPELNVEQALSEATTCFNHKEIIRGFSPAQHVLGQAPDETGRYLSASQGLPPDLLCENSQGEFARAANLRSEAEKALSEWQAKQRIMRAQHSRHRPCYDYQPGELVFYWRCQDANKGRRQPGGKHGRFLGPARILATESRRDESGNLRPGGAVWLVKGRSLLKCSPEQLRRASEREELLEAMVSPADLKVPWTYHMVAEQIGPLRGHLRFGRGTKRAGDQPAQQEPMDDDPLDLDLEAEPEPQGDRERSRSPRGGASGPSGADAAAWYTEVKDQSWPETASAYWSDHQAAVAIEIAMPNSRRGCERAWNNLGGYFVGSMRRRAVELSEKRMTAEDLEAFRGAKAIEVKNFIASQAFEVLPEHLRPDRSQAIEMRWILTWKLREDGSRKPKARAVLLGYQDGGYEHRATTSPVMTRQTRQLLLQMAAWKKWKVKKGDVTGAFLQSRAYPDKLYCVPCPEICEALGIPPNSVTKVQKACYGLVDAPLEWYRSVDEFLRQLGFERLWSDSCCWVLREKGVLRGIISGHVGDFLFGGQAGDELWESKLRAIKEHFKWGDWEEGKFTQCGVVIEQTESGFELSQPSYLENLSEIGVNASRRKNSQDPTSDREKSQLRALLGGLSWHAQQVAPYLAAEVGLLLTEVTKSCVDTMIRANTLLAHAKLKQSYKMKIHALPYDSKVMFVAWVDAANSNRIDGGSTQGIFVGATTENIMQGDVCDVSPVSWHSQKIDRSCRSPGAAEAQAAVNGEDQLFSTRFQWSEMLHGRPDLHRPDETVKLTAGTVVTDSRNVYDKLETEVMVIKGAEKRTSIEMLALKEAQACTNVQVRWVHSEAQLANTLTKSGGQREYDLYYRMGHKWRLVEDESMMSARRRKELGLLPLEQPSKRSKVKSCDLGSDQAASEPKSSTNLLQEERGA